MRVEFDGTIDERIAALLRAKGLSLQLWKVGVGLGLILVGVCSLCTLLLWQIPAIAASDIAKGIAMGVAFVAGLSALFLLAWYQRFDQRRSFRKMLHGSNTFRVAIELSARGVTVEDPTAQVFLSWSKIKAVYDRGKTIDIVTFHGHIVWVPKRAFESPEKEMLFVEAVKAYLAEQGRTQGVGGAANQSTGSIQKG